MILNERQNELLQLLKEKKKASVHQLAKTFFVSEATIRRDLTEMQTMGLIERSHGGAVLPENSEEMSMFFRIEKNPAEKKATASKALAHIPPFKSVFIDSSSTVLALVSLMDLSNKTVFTNNLHTALQLSKQPNVTIILLGGTVQYNTNASTGIWTARQLNDFSFDLMISSCSSIIDGTSYERSLDQKEIKKIAFERSQKRVLLVDSTKFTAHGSYRLKELESYDLVITNSKPPKELEGRNINFIY